MKRWQRNLVTTVLLLLTMVVATYHVGTAPPRPDVSKGEPHFGRSAFFPRENATTLNHLILEGTAMTRGRFAGRATVKLLEIQEAELQRQLARVIPSALMRRLLELSLMRWFSGIDEYFYARELDEMAGVGESASHQFDFLADGYTRQIAYHGIHEVGQMFVDMGGADMGCTVFAIPSNGGWAIGRNFDFEGGRIFDNEKILKWVFPERGLAYLSVIWAGMVGAVTGVNERGVYVSINAAGSTDFRRRGTPTTIAVSRMLEAAQSAEEAVQILADSTTFITDIFVVADGQDAFRVEKSPHRVFVERLEKPTVVANHLIDSHWQGDRINNLRKEKLTSVDREKRGQELLLSLRSSVPVERQLLTFLRDKGRGKYGRLPLGHRSAIDALIATHSVIYNSSLRHFWVSTGPSAAGPFLGFDLAASFRERRPATIAPLPADAEVSPERYASVKKMATDVAEAERLLKKDQCAEAAALLDPWQNDPEASYNYWTARGDWHRCRHEDAPARAAWTKALALDPAYDWERNGLKERLR